QLDSVVDNLAKLVLENHATVANLQKLASAFLRSPAIAPGDQIQSGNGSSLSDVKATIPAATPRKQVKKLTIGMATYDDYDGVYFTLQSIRLYHPEIVDEVEFIVIDNRPNRPCAAALKNFESWIPNYRYVPVPEPSGTAVREFVLQEASGTYV